MSVSKTIFLVVVIIICFAGDQTIRGLEWKEDDGGLASAPLVVSQKGKAGFRRLLSAKTGIEFKNLLDNERSIRNRNLLSGSGVAAGDFDGDGWCDLYFCGLDNGNRLYRNLGDWKFEDVTERTGVACAGQDSTAAGFADVDGDGDLDLLVNALGRGTRLFRNDGNFKLVEITTRCGLASTAGSMSMTLADIDGDGDLDLYVANFHPTTIKDRPNTKIRVNLVNGRPVVQSVNGVSIDEPKLKGRYEISQSRDILEYGEPDFLFINDGSGNFTKADYLERFRDENGERLAKPPMDWGLAARFADINQDGSPDLYVCNDLFTPDRIWMNDGKGRFRAIAKLAIRNTSTFSMGVDFADYDRDGDTDFFVVDMLSRNHEMQHVQISEMVSKNEPHTLLNSRPQISRNTLQVNRGDNTFAELAYYANVEASEWSWGPIFLDVDLDGYEDILVTNGQLRDFQNADMAAKIEAEKKRGALSQKDILNLISLFPDLRTQNVAFKNNRDGTFSDFSVEWGFAEPGISQGMALADLDNDGDMDVVMNNLLEEAGIYENLATGLRVRVELRGLNGNQFGIGSKVALRQGWSVQQQEIISGGRYLSSGQPVRSFGVPTGDFEITVSWPSGRISQLKSPKANFAYIITEPDEPALAKPVQPHPTPLFKDVSGALGHSHFDEPFLDFRRQLLIPFKYSQPGPGLCWHDINRDGWDDLIISSGTGRRLAMFRNEKDGAFKSITSPILKPTSWDQTMVLPFAPADGAPALMTGVSNYESGSAELPSIMSYDFAGRKVSEIRTGEMSSTGPMCQADLDGDGDLDLFVGGRIVPGQYPSPANSVLLENRESKFVVAHEWPKLGMVQGAVFSDITGDSRPELILSLHWDSLRVYSWEKGSWKAREITRELGLESHRGWWNGVATGDFNNDGRIDIAATNWGLNWRNKPTPSNPIRVYHGDMDGDGAVDAIESIRRNGKWQPERRLGVLRAAIPLVGERVSSFAQVGKSSVEQVFGELLESASILEAVEFRSMIFLNLKDGMKPVELPPEAQWAPGFGVIAEDFDGDRNQDLFIAQNFFATNPEYSRCDAGRGLLMLGDGHGGFEAIAASQSGVVAYGEQRACAVSDFNRDGRMDLAIGQNNAQTKLLLNNTGVAGIRVRLKGPTQNPAAVGAKVTLQITENHTLTKEVQSGSGYWAVNSSVLILPKLGRAHELTLAWPSGREVNYKIPGDIRELQLQESGEATFLKAR